MCCYGVLGIAFLMYYQINPVFVIVVLLLIFGTYFYFKRRNKGNTGYSRTGIFRSGRAPLDGGMSDMMTLFMYSQVLNQKPSEQEISKFDNSEELKKIDAQKKEILNILDGVE